MEDKLKALRNKLVHLECRTYRGSLCFEYCGVLNSAFFVGMWECVHGYSRLTFDEQDVTAVEGAKVSLACERY